MGKDPVPVDEPLLSIYLLGEFRLEYNHQLVSAVNTTRMQALLAYLVLHRQAPLMRQHMAFILWPDSTEKQARTNLRNLLFLLRRSLPEADRFLLVDARTMRWNPDSDYYLDVAEYERKLAERDLEAAVRLYAGDLMPSCYDDWIIAPREQLRRSYLEALDRLVDESESKGDLPGAVQYARRRLQQDSLREELYLRLMQLYASNGDQALAIRVYHQCATTLRRELGVEPGNAVRQFYETMLDRQVDVPALVSLPQSTLVGRTEELELMGRVWQSSLRGSPHLLVVSGEAGIGKTRLAQELIARAERQGYHFARAQSYPTGGSLAYAPIAEFLRAWPLPRLEAVWLTEIARINPEIISNAPHLSRPGPIREAWQRQIFYEALTRAFLGTARPVLFFIDDLQWCDAATIEWLNYFLHFDRNARLLVMATLRIEELESRGPIPDLFGSMRRAGTMVEISLQPLSELLSAQLATSLARESLTEERLSAIYRETEGNPLFIVESMRAASGEGGGGGKVQAVIQQRLGQLSAGAQRVAGVAAVIGRQFTFPVLARVAGGEEEDLVQALDELWLRYIVREQGAEAYDFSHGKIRAAVYEGLSAARRRLLHRKVAEALEYIFRTDLDDVSAQLAAHFARSDQAEKAILYYQRAADVAWSVYANADALAALRSAIALLPNVQDQVQRAELAGELYERLGDVLNLVGQIDEARHAYQQALDAWPGGARLARARLERKLGSILTGIHEDEAAMQAYDRADENLEAASGNRGDEWWHEWIEIRLHRMIWHYWTGQWRGMEPLIEETGPILERYGTTAQCMNFHRNLMRFGLRRERFAASQETLDHARMGLELAREIDDLYEIADGQFAYGFALLWHGDFKQAAQELEVALEMAERIEHQVLRLQSLAYLMVAQRRLGHEAEVDELIRLAEPMLKRAKRDDYLGLTFGNRAWLAWRQGDRESTDRLGVQALEQWGVSAHPFKWTALFPLIAVAASRDEIARAIEYCHALLDPPQHRLPDVLNRELEEAIAAWEQEDAPRAAQILEKALTLAQAERYL